MHRVWKRETEEQGEQEEAEAVPVQPLGLHQPLATVPRTWSLVEARQGEGLLKNQRCWSWKGGWARVCPGGCWSHGLMCAEGPGIRALGAT